MRHKIWTLALGAVACGAPQVTQAPPLTTEAVLAQATASDWRGTDPARTLYMDVNGGRVVIELAPQFAPQHVDNIRTLARAQFFDDLQVVRVQENYVVQWGDASGKKPVPVPSALPDEYTRTSAGLPFAPLPDGDVYAPEVGLSAGFPTARDPRSGEAWLTHCWSMVGVGRDMPPDNGNGAELYVVSGHAPRHLDRNLAVVGRVLLGMPFLTALPRGTEAMGFYGKSVVMPRIHVQLEADLPPEQRTAAQVLRTDTATWQAYVASRRNRREPFFVASSGHVELCNTLPPTRPLPQKP